jgi:predicted ATPase
MITKLHIKNFKSLKDTGNLDLKAINILTGLNGMGKSSLIQVLLLLRQSDDLSKGLKLRNGLVSIGNTSDALFHSANEEVIFIQIENNSELFSWQFDASSHSYFLNLLSKKVYKIDDLQKIAVFNNKFQYVSADRIAQTEMHEMSDDINKGFLGIRGEYTVHYLEAAQTGKIEVKIPTALRHQSVPELSDLIKQTDAWLGEISPGVRVNTKLVTSDQVQLGFSFGQLQTNPFKPKNVGFGLSYALSVITALLISKPNALIVIENPEAHLHPKGQAKLGELIAKAARNGAQIILETHSDHILNGIRVMNRLYYNDTKADVKIENRAGISNEDVAVFWFERDNHDFSSNIIPITIEANARIKTAPIGFFDQMDFDLKKILGF